MDYSNAANKVFLMQQIMTKQILSDAELANALAHVLRTVTKYPANQEGMYYISTRTMTLVDSVLSAYFSRPHYFEPPGLNVELS